MNDKRFTTYLEIVDGEAFVNVIVQSLDAGDYAAILMELISSGMVDRIGLKELTVTIDSTGGDPDEYDKLRRFCTLFKTVKIKVVGNCDSGAAFFITSFNSDEVDMYRGCKLTFHAISYSFTSLTLKDLYSHMTVNKQKEKEIYDRLVTRGVLSYPELTNLENGADIIITGDKLEELGIVTLKEM